MQFYVLCNIKNSKRLWLSVCQLTNYLQTFLVSVDRVFFITLLNPTRNNQSAQCAGTARRNFMGSREDWLTVWSEAIKVCVVRLIVSKGSNGRGGYSTRMTIRFWIFWTCTWLFYSNQFSEIVNGFNLDNLSLNVSWIDMHTSLVLLSVWRGGKWTRSPSPIRQMLGGQVRRHEMAKACTDSFCCHTHFVRYSICKFASCQDSHWS